MSQCDNTCHFKKLSFRKKIKIELIISYSIKVVDLIGQ